MRTKCIKVSEEEYLLVRMAQDLMKKSLINKPRTKMCRRELLFDGTMGSTIGIGASLVIERLEK
jgi:hypothetical protein